MEANHGCSCNVVRRDNARRLPWRCSSTWPGRASSSRPRRPSAARRATTASARCPEAFHRVTRVSKSDPSCQVGSRWDRHDAIWPSNPSHSVESFWHRACGPGAEVHAGRSRRLDDALPGRCSSISQGSLSIRVAPPMAAAPRLRRMVTTKAIHAGRSPLKTRLGSRAQWKTAAIGAHVGRRFARSSTARRSARLTAHQQSQELPQRSGNPSNATPDCAL